MADTIRVVGIGPGNPDYITPAALNIIRDSGILVGGERLLRQFKDLGKETHVIENNLAGVVEFIKSRRRERNIAVLASGDPAFYGILEYLKRHFPTNELQVVPGLSSVQLACARLCISWHDAAFYSVHGRETAGLVDLVKSHPKVIVLTDPKRTPAAIAGELAAAGVSDRKIYICENLSYEDEKVNEYTLDDVPDDAGTSGCVVVIVEK